MARSLLSDVYTDGACSSNGRDGARAGIGVWFGKDNSLNVSAPLQSDPHTNQRAELQAVLVALNIITRNIDAFSRTVIIHSDSLYTIRCLTVWAPVWVRNGWETSKKTSVKNRDIIEPALVCLHSLQTLRDVQFAHVRGHAGVEGNECADRLARAGASLKFIE